jgi:hypothetical protein
MPCFPRLQYVMYVTHSFPKRRPPPSAELQCHTYCILACLRRRHRRRPGDIWPRCTRVKATRPVFATGNVRSSAKYGAGKTPSEVRGKGSKPVAWFGQAPNNYPQPLNNIIHQTELSLLPLCCLVSILDTTHVPPCMMWYVILT